MKITQDKGPTIKFNGTMIAETDLVTRGNDPMLIVFQIWETLGGTYIAVKRTAPFEREGHEAVAAHAVELSDDRQAMQREVMGFFNWEDRVRTMVRKELGWDTSLRVE